MKKVTHSPSGRAFAPSNYISGPFEIRFNALSTETKKEIPPDIFVLIQNSESTSGAMLIARIGDTASCLPGIGQLEFRINSATSDKEPSIRTFRLPKKALLYVGTNDTVIWKDPLA